MSQVASITQERQFAASMGEESTQLAIIDEWSENTLQSDMAKSVLQGGFMVKSVKHQTPKCTILHNHQHFTKFWCRGCKCSTQNCMFRDNIFTGHCR